MNKVITLGGYVLAGVLLTIFVAFQSIATRIDFISSQQRHEQSVAKLFQNQKDMGSAINAEFQKVQAQIKELQQAASGVEAKATK